MAAAILDFEKLLPLHYLLTDRHQIQYQYCFFDWEHIGVVKKSKYHDFYIVFYSNFLSGMHGFRDNEVLFKAGYDVIVISPTGGA